MYVCVCVCVCVERYRLHCYSNVLLRYVLFTLKKIF